ncbi:hypothetical protein UPYG_G00172840 [Umbra pygmaea]|uniref:Uncharacterized protein n=1 Tax=Umbra pygmaea TaxID=75934 RepID=A0ABD0WTY2_UMBPY
MITFFSKHEFTGSAEETTQPPPLKAQRTELIFINFKIHVGFNLTPDQLLRFSVSCFIHPLLCEMSSRSF